MNLAALLRSPFCDKVRFISPALGFQARWQLLFQPSVAELSSQVMLQELQDLAALLQLHPDNVQRLEVNLRVRASYLQTPAYAAALSSLKPSLWQRREH